MLGIAVALGCAAFFGLYMAPRKLCKMGGIPFLLTMMIGVLGSLLVAWLLAGRPHDAHGFDVALSAFCGVLWTLGTLFFILGVMRLGLAVSTTIKNTTAVWGALFGIVLFHEGIHTEPVTCVLGSVLIALAACVMGLIGSDNDRSHGLSVPGLAYSLLASLCYAAYTIPMKVVRAHGVSFLEVTFYMAFGAAVTGLLMFTTMDRDFRAWARQPLRDHAYALLAGVLWSVAVLTMTVALDLVGLAVTWPIANVNTVFAVALGVFVFREISVARHGRMLALGMFFAVGGVCLLGLSKALR